MASKLLKRIQRLEAGSEKPPELWAIVKDQHGQPLATVRAGELAAVDVADPLALLFVYYGPTVNAGVLVAALPLSCWLALARPGSE